MSEIPSPGARDVEQLFAGDFGVAYTERNSAVNPKKPAFFHDLFRRHGIHRILECGSNIGLNLTDCLADPDMDVWGIDIQRHAIEQAWASRRGGNFVVGSIFDLPFRDGHFDIAFTSGVLIHVPTAGLGDVLREMYRVSKRWLMCVEYHDEQEVTVPWRGQAEALWRRNYRQVVLETLPDLIVVEEGYKTADEGFDRAHWHLFRKP